jgi:glycosyltransferase involved in cell wall biosynthesis
MPKNHEHAFDPNILELEEKEYKESNYLLCPSDFVKKTFLDNDFPEDVLLRHQYGYDENEFFPSPSHKYNPNKLRVLFVGGCAPRKGLHFALEAWLNSKASSNGTLKIAGGFIPEYKSYLSKSLSHPSVTVLGHSNNVPLNN